MPSSASARPSSPRGTELFPVNASSPCGLAAGVAAEEVAEAPCTEAAAPAVGTLVVGDPGTLVAFDPGRLVVGDRGTVAVGTAAASSPAGTRVVVEVSLTPVTFNLQVSRSKCSRIETATVIVFSPVCSGDRRALIDPPSPSA